MYIYKEYPPTEEDKALARQSKQVLATHAQKDQSLKLQVVDGNQQPTIELPHSAVQLLMDILGTIASGQGVTISAQDAELTTSQLAQMMNVSRPYVVKLLDEGVIPHHKVGTHRRVRLQDAILYQLDIKRKRAQVLAELVAEAQDEDMGY